LGKLTQRLKHRTIFYFAILILLINSCKKDIVFNFDKTENKLVLYPYLFNNLNITVKLFRSRSIIDTTTSLPKNGKVIVFDNHIPVDTISINSKGIGLSDIIAVKGHQYRFLASADEYKDAECTVQIPNPVKQITVDTNWVNIPYGYMPGTERYLKITTTLFDEGSTTDYYKISCNQEAKVRTLDQTGGQYNYVYKIRSGQSRIILKHPFVEFFLDGGNNTYYTAQINQSILNNESNTISFNNEEYFQGYEFYLEDKLFQGGKVEIISFIRESDLWYLNTNLNFKEYVLFTEISTINQEYYLSLKSLSAYNIKQKEDFSFGEIAPIYSSVLGGFGFPAAINQKSESTIKSRW